MLASASQHETATNPVPRRKAHFLNPHHTTLLFCLGPTYSPSPSRAVSFMFSVLWEYFVPWSYVVVPLLVAIVTFAPLCCWCR